MRPATVVVLVALMVALRWLRLASPAASVRAPGDVAFPEAALL